MSAESILHFGVQKLIALFGGNNNSTEKVKPFDGELITPLTIISCKLYPVDGRENIFIGRTVIPHPGGSAKIAGPEQLYPQEIKVGIKLGEGEEVTNTATLSVLGNGNKGFLYKVNGVGGCRRIEENMVDGESTTVSGVAEDENSEVWTRYSSILSQIKTIQTWEPI